MSSVGFSQGFSLKQQVLHQLIFSHEDTPDNTHNAGLTLHNIIGDFKKLWEHPGAEMGAFEAVMGIEETDSSVLQIQKIFKCVLGEHYFNQLCGQPHLSPMATRGSVLNFLKENYYRQDYLTFWEKVADASQLPLQDGIERLSAFELRSALTKWMEDHRDQIQQITKLALSFRSGGLKHLPDAIGLLTGLEELFLINNNLRFLPESIGALVNLRKLFLSRNELASLPESFSKLQSLIELDLNSNNFQTFPEPVTQLSNLLLLNMDQNALTDLPTSFEELQQIETLNLTGNQLVSLPPVLSQLEHLHTLDLNNNPLEFLLDVLAQLHTLQNLDLRNTHIIPSRELISQLPNLQTLTLDSMQSTVFREFVVDLGFTVAYDREEVCDLIEFRKQEVE